MDVIDPFLFRYESGFEADDAHLQPIVSVVMQGRHLQVDDTGRSHDLSEGSLCFMPAGVPHRHAAGPSGTLVLSAGIPSAFAPTDAPFSLNQPAAVEMLLRLLAASRCQNRAGRLDKEAWSEELVAEVFARKADERPAKWIARVRDALYDGSERDISLGSLARTVGYDRCHVAKVFRATYGKSLGEYLRDVRLSKAARALANEPDRSIADVAAAAGFYDQSHFVRTFRGRFGCAPVDWRRDVIRIATAVQG